MITLPGLIDTHVHLREPGATQKEDFETGTKASLAGGYTAVLDMPNNPEPTVTPHALEEKIKLTQGVILNPSLHSRVNSVKDLSLASLSRRSGRMRVPNESGDSSPAKPDQNDGSRIYCDVGFHFGATLDSSQYFQEIKTKVFGLKVYMNHTTGTLLQKDPAVLQTIFESWPKNKVLMVHAEGETLKVAIELTRKNNNKLHVCHVSLASEISLIKQAKLDGLSITCEVTAHHLFLTEKDAKKLGPFGMMRPPLRDPNILWKAVKDQTIDMIASDHAPHTKEEKLSPNPPNGVPGLETTLPLLLTAVSQGKLTIEDIIRLCHTNPKRIFSIPEQKDTFVEIDPTVTYNLSPVTLFTKCQWTPFQGKRVKGKVKRVVLRGKEVFKDGEVLGNPQGSVIYPI